MMVLNPIITQCPFHFPVNSAVTNLEDFTSKLMPIPLTPPWAIIRSEASSVCSDSIQQEAE